MAKTRLENLTEYLFGQLEKISETMEDNPISDIEFEKELKRTDAIVQLSGQLLSLASTQLKAAELSAKLNDDTIIIPDILVNKKTLQMTSNGEMQ